MGNGDIASFLADTWWFGLSKRLSEKDFIDLAALRAGQGFSAIQLVVGVPPEVGPENENAKSQVGFPWKLDGHFNQEYLKFAQDRIQYLNDRGFVVIVYGAWGHQNYRNLGCPQRAYHHWEKNRGERNRILPRCR